MKRTRKTGWFALLVALFSQVAAAGPLAYAVNFVGQFGSIDISSGVFTPIGPGTPNGIDGIGGVPGGPFYGVDAATGHLLSIGTNGSITDVGDTGTGGNFGPTGISINSSLTNGTLYGLDFQDRLVSLNPSTGAATILGTVAGLPPSEQVYQGNLATSLAGSGTDLFFTIEVPTGPFTTGPTLFDINPLTRTSTSHPLTGIDGVIGSGWINGQLIGFADTGEIVQINTSTGVATVIGHYDSGITPDGPPLTGIFGAVQAVPEPGTLAAGFAGIGLLLALRLRRLR